MIRCVSALLLVAGTLAASQIVNDPDYKLSVDVELVQLPVSVSHPRGLPVRDLRLRFQTGAGCTPLALLRQK